MWIRVCVDVTVDVDAGVCVAVGATTPGESLGWVIGFSSGALCINYHRAAVTESLSVEHLRRATIFGGECHKLRGPRIRSTVAGGYALERPHEEARAPELSGNHLVPVWIKPAKLVCLVSEVSNGKGDRESGARARLALQGDSPALRRHQIASDGES